MLERIKTPQGDFYRLNWWYTSKRMNVIRWLVFAAALWLSMWAMLVTDVVMP
jgi:hypothetical protein